LRGLAAPLLRRLKALASACFSYRTALEFLSNDGCGHPAFVQSNAMPERCGNNFLSARRLCRRRPYQGFVYPFYFSEKRLTLPDSYFLTTG
jgi:hypothetical protein